MCVSRLLSDIEPESSVFIDEKGFPLFVADGHPQGSGFSSTSSSPFSASKPSRRILLPHALQRMFSVSNDPSSLALISVIMYVASDSSSGEIGALQDGQGNSPSPSMLFKFIRKADSWTIPFASHFFSNVRRVLGVFLRLRNFKSMYTRR